MSKMQTFFVENKAHIGKMPFRADQACKESVEPFFAALLY